MHTASRRASSAALCTVRRFLYTFDVCDFTYIYAGWTSSAESPATLQDFFDIIAYTIKLSDLFQVQGSSTPAGTATATAAPAPASTASYGSTSSAATAKGTSSMQHTSNTSRTHVHGGVGKGARAQSPTWEEWISPEVSENNPSYVFRGLVCYYGKHYVSIFQGMDGGHDNFLLFDDHTIKPIGDWNAVKDKCVKSHYQPVLLLYELEQAKI